MPKLPTVALTRFQALVEDIRKALAARGDAHRPAHHRQNLSAEFVVGDVAFDLLHLQQGPSGRPCFLLQCRCGSVTHPQGEQVMRDLLSRRASSDPALPGAVGVNGRGELMMVSLLQAGSEQAARHLSNSMVELSEVVSRWRDAQRPRLLH
ncbi:MAG: hypothetical protein KF871_15025 [Hydrogenophaga sp.]|uniref:hypothetical protein n=1 Tax=Hydrogenophaga sp. TaxID=1904254 RepID=UPI001D2FC364|nr:hypothetical protein [Hydrogenophaga sp.]MBX3611202.1 hypothetical protein [Hydrogenophaga sp.]